MNMSKYNYELNYMVSKNIVGGITVPGKVSAQSPNPSGPHINIM